MRSSEETKEYIYANPGMPRWWYGRKCVINNWGEMGGFMLASGCPLEDSSVTCSRMRETRGEGEIIG